MHRAKNVGTQKALLFGVIIFVSLCDGERLIKEKDNIAVEQHAAPLFIVPAPGIRFIPQTGGNLKQNYETSGNGLDDFVGHLLPLHPRQSMPQIVSLDVACYPNRMAASIVFDYPFNGIIYSKGFHGVQDCTYTVPNSGQRTIQFELHSQGCGMQYIEQPGKPAYMENVIIIQNEPNIQEIWDTARGIRCLFDGGAGQGRNRQTVSAALNVAMLEQQVVTFSSRASASASMDIQVGRGPYAPSASGVVKIGELMTMVVAVEGPSEMDILVRQCIAHDGTNDNAIDLTDEEGCVIKKKIIGSWQKKRGSGSSSSPVIAFAHFQAFKFPDKMDVYIECEVDLCNGQCAVCSEDNLEFKQRRRRGLPKEEEPIPDFKDAIDAVEESSSAKFRGRNSPNDLKEGDNKTENAGLRLARRLRVLSPDDIALNGDEFSTYTLVTKTSSESGEDVCMSLVSFVTGIIVMLVILITSSVLTAVLCIRVRTIPSSESSFPPDSSFHAFSTVSGKTT